ncbi:MULTISPECIES: replication-relaxation family protein [Streptomyces]|uniref:replication-relaxation family protein n=1 Tax=Streptomyces TaxID=1883 RepID=UPI0013316CC7|nr:MULTISPECIES: replication-relaxation family protein [Streptomyces]
MREVAIVHVTTASQIARLLFPDRSAEDAARAARQLLLRLERFGLTRKLTNPTRERRGGRPGYLHVLTEAGLRLTGVERAPGQRQRRSWRPSYHFVDHRLAITELYVRLREYAQANGSEMKEYQAEPDSWRHYTGFAGERLVLKPDALTRLLVPGLKLRLSWFIEVDRDTESPRRIAEKCTAYRRYELSEVEFRRFGVFPGVMFIVPDEARARVIRRVIAKRPAEDRGLFAVTTDNQAMEALHRPLPVAADQRP